MKTKQIILPILILAGAVILMAATSQQIKSKLQSEKELDIVFYNVENLFDTLDNPLKIDEEFLPDGRNKWTSERYTKKLDDLAKVIMFCNSESLPDIIGLCEVENADVVADLAAKTDLKPGDYKIVHYESPDQRGIDVALMYSESIKGFRVESHHRIRLDFPLDSAYTSRDILYTEASIRTGFFSRQKLHLFVNHWPSRRDGPEVSIPRRRVAAKALKEQIDSIYSQEPNAAIIVMGDFNDEPSDVSISEELQALSCEDPGMSSARVVDMMTGLKSSGQGTYNYRGDWNMLDHFMISPAMLNGKGKIKADCGSVGICQADWMMFKSDNYGLTPSRTYGGPNYYGGFSDHLAISLLLEIGK